ncbi:MAG TPA: PEGA domain-containing protein [Chitinispirillaceae bacterium]|nr:PEGA domain-containing protein [Chitinispirillaceae bacterium]
MQSNKLFSVLFVFQLLFLLTGISNSQPDNGIARFLFVNIPPNSIISVDDDTIVPDSSGWYTIKPGLRKIELFRSETLVYTSTRLFSENEEKKYTFYCNEDCGGVEVTTIPPGAHLFIDEEYNAVTPAIHNILSPGIHSLKIDMPGWTTVYKDFEITENNINHITITLERSKSFLDSITTSRYQKHKSGKRVLSAVLSVITASLGAASIWYDYTAKHHLSQAGKASDLYDNSINNFQSFKSDYYESRSNAKKAIKNRNILAAATGISLAGFIISLTF